MTKHQTDAVFPDLIKEVNTLSMQDVLQTTEVANLGGKHDQNEQPDAPSQGAANVTDRAGALPKSTQSVARTPTGTRLLSELLNELNPEHRTNYLKNFDEAVAKGTFDSIPLIDGKIRHRGGKNREDIYRKDELVIATVEFTAWHDQQLREARYLHMAATGEIESTLERLISGEDDLQRLIALRREHLNKKHKSR